MLNGDMFILTRHRPLVTSCIPKAYLFLSCLKHEMLLALQKKKKNTMNRKFKKK